MAIPFDRNAQRIAAIDWLRGIVMILMALDHTSLFFNTNRIFADSVLLYEPGVQFAADQFFTRWITHICAPTFIFLAGTSIAISNFQQRQQGISNAIIDRELLLRGAFIAMIDLCIISLVSGKPIFQVLYAIGISMMLMVYLQRLGIRTVFFLALLLIAGSELLLLVLWQPDGEVPFWLAITFAPVFDEVYTVLYPALPWLGIMLLGWVFGQRLISTQSVSWAADRLLMTIGCFLLTLFVVIRGLDGYGNMFMYLEGNTLTQWLHVSKYPPSLAYTLLELGLIAIILALLMRLESIKKIINPNGPVLVFGQTALFFYLAHFCVLAVLKSLFERGSLEQTYWITLAVLIILYPICRIYRSLKYHYSHSLLRFL
ncbi:DUF1624 domain-containing protein [Nitrosomonas supralitoralis]|uniref:Heparan-alpha-glucosaminide N-acetyltransferase catalytic domain-containing protein n=1 Tax=Nitrosomonas supralitoralis TaxID=2116706 RepID=A0A2P7NTM4_9PROT|nr:heparan-alpha-glucosaminide N-acetyltransferase domain-containing protein [Nitrosomonas supralitoralis]PSJ16822.1 hypothetical protein C7H79_11455 [Nitrosomonas supralitoralis]